MQQHATTFHNTPQHATTCHNMPQHSTTCHNLTQHATTFHDMPQYLTHNMDRPVQIKAARTCHKIITCTAMCVARKYQKSKNHTATESYCKSARHAASLTGSLSVSQNWQLQKLLQVSMWIVTLHNILVIIALQLCTNCAISVKNYGP